MGTNDLPKKQKTGKTVKAAVKSAKETPVEARIVREETDRIIRYLTDRVQKIDLKQFKEKLHSYIEHNFREMSAFYLFDKGEFEKPPAPRHGAADSLKDYTDALLRKEAGGFIKDENADNIIKCSFIDNPLKPKTVTDVNLRLNVPDSVLIQPATLYNAAAAYLIKDVISGHVIECFNKEIDSVDDSEKANISAAELLDKVTEMEEEAADIFSNNPAIENIRDKGFAASINALATLLENANMDYQYIENVPDKRELIIREYEDTEVDDLPDERYSIRLSYNNEKQLAEERKFYDALIGDFESKIRHLWDLIGVLYKDSKSVFKVNDYEDLARKNKGRVKYMPEEKSEEELYGREWALAKLVKMRERANKIYASISAAERDVLEERLSRLETDYVYISGLANPHQLKAGIFIDMEITTIKRKKTTLTAMASVLNEFVKRLICEFN